MRVDVLAAFIDVTWFSGRRRVAKKDRGLEGKDVVAFIDARLLVKESIVKQCVSGICRDVPVICWFAIPNLYAEMDRDGSPRRLISSLVHAKVERGEHPTVLIVGSGENLEVASGLARSICLERVGYCRKYHIEFVALPAVISNGEVVLGEPFSSSALSDKGILSAAD